MGASWRSFDNRLCLFWFLSGRQTSLHFKRERLNPPQMNLTHQKRRLLEFELESKEVSAQLKFSLSRSPLTEKETRYLQEIKERKPLEEREKEINRPSKTLAEAELRYAQVQTREAETNLMIACGGSEEFQMKLKDCSAQLKHLGRSRPERNRTRRFCMRTIFIGCSRRRFR